MYDNVPVNEPNKALFALLLIHNHANIFSNIHETIDAILT